MNETGGLGWVALVSLNVVQRKMSLQISRCVGGNFNAACLQHGLLIRHQVAQLVELNAHLVASLLNGLFEAIEIVPVAAQIGSRFNPLIGVCSSAIYQFQTF